MPKISERAIEMPASPIRKLVPLADAAKQRGVKIYHLNIGQPDLPTPQEGLDALKKIDRKVLEYSPSDGYLSLREKLVGYYDQYQIKLSADDIIITTGGSEAVLFAFMSCLNPGDEIIVPEPAYANYMAFAISAGAVIRTVSTSIEEGFALPKVEQFEELINERTRGILICNPNNPTGYLYTRKEMNRIRDLVKKYDLFLFSDEVYREFIYTGSPYISACHLEGIEQNVVLIDSVSKRYSECGIRIGLTGSVGNDGRIACPVCHGNGIHGLRQRADLIHFDQYGVTNSRFDTLLQPLGIGNKQIVADQLHFTAQSLGQHRPAFPVSLSHTVFQRDYGIFTC